MSRDAPGARANQVVSREQPGREGGLPRAAWVAGHVGDLGFAVRRDSERRRLRLHFVSVLTEGAEQMPLPLQVPHVSSPGACSTRQAPFTAHCTGGDWRVLRTPSDCGRGHRWASEGAWSHLSSYWISHGDTPGWVPSGCCVCGTATGEGPRGSGAHSRASLLSPRASPVCRERLEARARLVWKPGVGTRPDDGPARFLTGHLRVIGG